MSGKDTGSKGVFVAENRKLGLPFNLLLFLSRLRRFIRKLGLFCIFLFLVSRKG